MPWATVEGINIKIVCPPANPKHTRLSARTLQLALPEGAESFHNIESHTLGTRSGVPQPLVGATKAEDTELRVSIDQLVSILVNMIDRHIFQSLA